MKNKKQKTSDITEITEITIQSEWGKNLEETKNSGKNEINLESEVPFPGIELFIIRKLFSDVESCYLLNEAEKFGYGVTPYPKAYRGNLRLTAFDQTLSNLVWQRISPFVPMTVEENGLIYKATGLNYCWRLAKYFPGDRFCSHVDTCFRDYKTNQKSMFTVNIYMNHDFIGGNTLFYFDEELKNNCDVKNEENANIETSKTKNLDIVNEKNLVLNTSKTENNITVIKQMIPEAGLCLIFRQPTSKRYLHEGEEVLSGYKYLFRSDIMYKILVA